MAGKLKRFVEAGGVLVVTPRTGVKDKTNAVVNQVLPGLLAELCGVEVEEYVSMPDDLDGELEFTLPNLDSKPRVSAQVWCDVLKPNGATVVARYSRDFYAGKPALTLNQYGQGQVVYVGSMGDELFSHTADWLLDLAGIQPLLTTPEGVEVSERWQGDQQLLFVLNHTEQEQEVTLDKPYKDLLNNSAPVAGKITLAPLDVLILLNS